MHVMIGENLVVAIVRSQVRVIVGENLVVTIVCSQMALQ